MAIFILSSPLQKHSSPENDCSDILSEITLCRFKDVIPLHREAQPCVPFSGLCPSQYSQFCCHDLSAGFRCGRVPPQRVPLDMGRDGLAAWLSENFMLLWMLWQWCSVWDQSLSIKALIFGLPCSINTFPAPTNSHALAW